MPLFKNYIFPLRKILSLPSLLLGTLCVYVFSSVLYVIYVAGRFSVFVFPKCHPLGVVDNDPGNGKRPMKHGKGQGGQKARYATQILPAAHVHKIFDHCI